MDSIVHFEIPAVKVERAKAFYESIFGWKIERYAYEGKPYWSVITAPMDAETKLPLRPGAINGGMMERASPGQGVMNYINVHSIDETLKKIEAHGGAICMPKQEIAPGMGWIAAFRDTEGNMMGLHQMSPKH